MQKFQDIFLFLISLTPDLKDTSFILFYFICKVQTNEIFFPTPITKKNDMSAPS
jgi:hypothetical protein